MTDILLNGKCPADAFEIEKIPYETGFSKFGLD